MYEDPEEATLRAVDICIEQGVLVDILRKHKAEVISMVLSSFNQEAYEEDMYETGYKEGERRINTLYEKLLKEQRMDDMKRAVEDEAYRETLLKEYDLYKELAVEAEINRQFFLYYYLSEGPLWSIPSQLILHVTEVFRWILDSSDCPEHSKHFCQAGSVPGGW